MSVSIHDVAPSTWPLCERLIDSLHAVAPMPLTLLVVPAFHRLPTPRVPTTPTYERQLERCLARGDELALHGYVHLDEAPRARSPVQRYRREIFTTREGEFSALDAAQATQRIEAGLAWFARRGWPVAGFVAPAWLLSDGAWTALRQFPFSYTTTMRHFHLLPQQLRLTAPSLVYAARNAAGRFASRHVNDLLAARQCERPLIRLALHPADARHPELLQHCQRLVARLLEHHTPLTKNAFVQRQLIVPCAQWQSVAPGRGAGAV